MRPPSRTISAARRISRSCGLSGCSSKYWLTERVSSGARHSARAAGIIRARFRPAADNSRHRDADTTRIRTAGSPSSSSTSSAGHLSGHRRAHGRDGAAAGLRLAAHAQGPADAPGHRHTGAGVRRGHADPARRALPAVESLGVLLARRRSCLPAACGSARRRCSNACSGRSLPEDVTVPPASWRNASLLIGVSTSRWALVNIWVA